MNESLATIGEMRRCGHPVWADLWQQDVERLVAQTELVSRLARAIEELGGNVEPFLGDAT